MAPRGPRPVLSPVPGVIKELSVLLNDLRKRSSQFVDDEEGNKIPVVDLLDSGDDEGEKILVVNVVDSGDEATEELEEEITEKLESEDDGKECDGEVNKGEGDEHLKMVVYVDNNHLLDNYRSDVDADYIITDATPTITYVTPTSEDRLSC